MAFAVHSTPVPSDDLWQLALDNFVSELLEEVGPKGERKARKRLEAFAARLETFNGRHFPGPNVLPIRGPTWSEREKADEARRRERSHHAAVIRTLVERYL